MGRYVIRRLLQMIPVFIGATLLIFLMVNVMGDPIAGLCGDRACDPATAAQLEKEFGLDKPVWQQYLIYMGNLFTGDFGTAFNGQPVTELMANSFPVTIRLTIVAILFEIVIGISLGVLTGLKRGRPIDSTVLVLTLVVLSIPTFVTGLLLQLLLGVQWGWIKPAVSPEAPFSELIVPGFVLASVSSRTSPGSPGPRSRRTSAPTTSAPRSPRACRVAASSPATCCATRSSRWSPSSAPTSAR